MRPPYGVPEPVAVPFAAFRFAAPLGGNVLSSESQAQKHVAMPKLMGAPAYARPPRQAEVLPRPVDPDDLPLEAERTPEEQEIAGAIGPVDSFVSYGAGGRSAEGGATAEEAGERARSPLGRLGLRRG